MNFGWFLWTDNYETQVFPKEKHLQSVFGYDVWEFTKKIISNQMFIAKIYFQSKTQLTRTEQMTLSANMQINTLWKILTQ